MDILENMIELNVEYLFDADGKYERIFDTIRYLNMLKSNISDACSHKFKKIKINSDDDVPI